MKKYVFLAAAIFFLLCACNDTAKKRTFSARTEAEAPDSMANADTLQEEDSVSVNDNQEDHQLNISIKLTIADADSTGGTIDITENGVLYKRIFSKGINYPVELQLNTYYLVKCSKKGCTPKVVYFDTHIPAGRQKEEFAKFMMTVELHKTTQGPGVNTDVPVGGVKYNTSYDDFDKAEK